MKRKIAALLVGLVGLLPVLALAQNVFLFQKATPVSAAVVADDTSVAVLVKYYGTATSADVAVAANGDITFRQNAVADTTLECPVSGALGGVIDVSDAACNTLGEVVDQINKSSVWRAVILDGLRSDTADDSLLTFGATEATLAQGLALKFDTDTVGFLESRALSTCRTIDCLIPARGLTSAGVAPPLEPNPWKGTQTVFFYANATSTYGSGNSNFQVYSVIPKLTAAGASEQANIIYQVAGGATTVNKEFTVWQNVGLYGDPDAKVIARLKNSAAMASVTFIASGRVFYY